MSRGPHAISADFVFDGDVLHRDTAVAFDDGRVTAIMPRSELPAAVPVYAAPSGAWLAPGLIDLQVNGGGDFLFNDAPTPATIARIVAAHRRFGTTSLLPTLISDTHAQMRAALQAAAEAATTEPGVLGIHLEGPFLSPEKVGAHDPSMLRSPNVGDEALLTAPHRARILVTLAPEQVPEGFIAKLTARGIRVAIGHSMATYAQTKQALQEGARGFTHLFNAMRPLGSREPGPIAAALETPDAFFGMIVDGIHVDPTMLRLALRGRARPMLVTDAMPPVGGRSNSFALYGDRIVVSDGACVRADGTLAGTALDMAQAVHNSVTLLEVPLTAALQFASTNPAEFMGVGDTLGRLRPGYRADVVAFLPDDLQILSTWVAGQQSITDQTPSLPAFVRPR
jgi:N-acetylglucosamine-6-phosphate deacetylase